MVEVGGLSMFSALVYLQTRLFWNRGRVQVRRLRQPKYLAGTVAGAVYVYFFLIRGLLTENRSAGTPRTPLDGFGPEYGALIEIGAALLMGLMASAAWLFPTKRAVLDFTEAEIAFLFTAPIGRTTLIHYRILRSQIPLLFGALIMTLFSGRFVQGGHAWMHWIGWWLILAALELHRLGAAFARTRLMDRGVTRGRRRLMVLSVLALLAVAFWVWAKVSLTAPSIEDVADASRLADYLRQTAQTGPWFWLLLPLRWMIRPVLAGSIGAFALALVPATGLLAALYFWVVRSQVSFEEATIEHARTRAVALAAVRSGRWQAGAQARKRAAPFRLAPLGHRPIALFWKNLISMGTAFTPRFWVAISLLAFVGTIMMRQFMPGSVGLKIVGLLPVALVPMLFLVVPQMLTMDLRQDLAMIDTLKTYPMPGWQLVLGEVLAPALVLTGVQCLCLAWGVAFFPELGSAKEPSVSERLAIGLALGIVAPGLNLISLLIHNATVLLFPGWARMGPGQARGFEAMGRGILLMIGQMTALALALLLPAAAFGAVFFVGQLWVSWSLVLPAAALAALTLLLAEGYAALRMLGDWFERMDLSTELVLDTLAT